MPTTHFTKTTTRVATPPPIRRGTLLIVDDEEGPRQSLRVIFKDDYELLLADDGPKAIELAQQHDVDVAVCDIRMAGMSGIEVLERLKYVDSAIEVVMITAFETTDTIRQALRLRACDYINKPFDLATMRAAVAGAMQRRTLESAINNNTEQLQALLTEMKNHQIAEQIARERSNICSEIIHDLNGPLTSIASFVHTLNRRVGRASQFEAGDLDYFKHRLKDVAREITKCIAISRRYLSLQHRQTGDVPRVGLHQIFRELEHSLREHPSLLHNKFTVHPPAEDMGVNIQGTDLLQILLNLCVNAFQSSPRGCQVDITGDILRQPLDLTTFKDSPDDRWLNVERFANTTPLVRLSVRDTGPGIPPEILPQIFQPYFSTKGPRQGTGLGLSIVHRLIREAATALHVHTGVGKGTTFTLYLPAAPLAK